MLRTTLENLSANMHALAEKIDERREKEHATEMALERLRNDIEHLREKIESALELEKRIRNLEDQGRENKGALTIGKIIVMAILTITCSVGGSVIAARINAPTPPTSTYYQPPVPTGPPSPHK